MHIIQGYHIIRELHTSHDTIVYRAQRQADDMSVVLKILNEPTPTAERLAWFRREYDILRSLHIPGVIGVSALERHPLGWVLVLEDIGGESLANLRLAGQLDLTTFLRLAQKLTHILGQVHEEHIVHKDINPANIVYNPTTTELRLIDFNIATRLRREIMPFRSPAVMEGTLSYLAPEQTGRMNRAIDYRSDFYALGVTFYELLTGQVPFKSDDPLEVIHSHIARLPVPPHEHAPTIPAPVSAIILKLLAKDADKRYQSAYGLHADLECCRHQFERDGVITPFTLARQDASDRFVLAQKLYGREAELATLRATFAQMAAGSSALLLVVGEPGIGKTALVNETHSMLTERRGAFISGKFDQMQRNAPYMAFAQAFRGLVRHILTEPEAVLQQWRTRISAALGPNAHVIVEVIPDLVLLIGEPQPVPELGPQEAQNRFLLVFQHFLAVFARPDHPLVLFLDDVQWADSGSLKLLEQILANTAGGYLLVIGAYRDTEVPPGHPLWATLDSIRQAGGQPQTLTLGPLDDAAVLALVQDTLLIDGPTAQPLARLIQQKTGGNPFFVGEFLKALYSEGLLTFSLVQSCWTWELAQIEARQMTANVVELQTQQVQRLPDRAQQVLRRAACIGNRFDLATLAAVLEQPPAETATHLEPALLAGLIEPLSVGYKLMTLDVAGLADRMLVEYRFAHDRIQQAAYEQVPADQRPDYHWRIGRRLLASTPAAQREERLFDMVGQLNAGRTLADATERHELAGLNLEAGKRAKASAAFTPAASYFQVGLDLLPADAWQQHYDLALRLHQEAAEVAYINGDFAAMEHLIALVLAHVCDVLDTVTVYAIKIQAASSQAHFLDAIQAGIAILHQFGINLPQPEQANVAQAFQDIQEILDQHSLEELLARPRMTDPVALATSDLLFQVCAPAYIGVSILVPQIISEIIRLSLRAGNTAATSYAYIFYAVMLVAFVGDIEMGYRIGELAVRLMERLQAHTIRSRIMMIFNCHVRTWEDPLRSSLPHFTTAYHVALETGDLEYAGFLAFNLCTFPYLIGEELETVARDTTAYHQTVSLLKQTVSTHFLVVLGQMVANLRGQAENPVTLQGEWCDEAELVPTLTALNDANNLFVCFLYKLILAYLFGDNERLPEYIQQMEQYIESMAAHPTTAVANFYASLARLRVCADAPAARQAGLLEEVAANQQQLARWAHHAPVNYQHKWHLVEAERCRVLKQMAAAREHYDQAIAGAQEHQFIQEEALAYELAGRFYLARGQARLAWVYLHDAHATYLQWGAAAKVWHLESQYTDLFTVSAGPAQRTTTQSTRLPSTSTSSSTTMSALDVASIVKASQAISGEMQLEALLARLLHVLLENAGADRGTLLLNCQQAWLVEAEGRLGQAIAVLQSLPREQADLPHSLISYVLRTRESIVLNNAPVAGAFTHDSYIQTQQPASILALPLVYKGDLTGLLYLENTHTADAFTQERQEMLALLSGQVVISLENARLYTQMEHMVDARTSELKAANNQLAATLAELETTQAERTRLQQQVIDAQRDTLRQLATPLIPISDQVVIMPLVGAIDIQRAHQVMETLLEGVVRYHARLAILDITGMLLVDAPVAQALIEAAQAVQLLGARVMLTGVQPQLAHTLVHLGVDLSGIQTQGSLQAGIAAAMHNRDMRLWA